MTAENFWFSRINKDPEKATREEIWGLMEAYTKYSHKHHTPRLVGDLLADWEHYKTTWWWESNAIDVKRILMDQFIKLMTDTPHPQPVGGDGFGHLMLDIETMGNKSFSSIISIGALEFDINTGETGREFYTNIHLQSCIDMGLGVDASTVMWWLKQSETARKDLVERPALLIRDALNEFAEFCNKDYQIWGNSARFDCGILQNAYDKADLPIPWDFRKERCVRTLVSFNPETKKNYPSVGTAHNALSDCYFQVGYCSKIWSEIYPLLKIEEMKKRIIK